MAKAAPDGYTFGVSITGPMVNNTVLYKDLPYVPKKDIDPLTLGVHQPNILVVPASSPIKSLDELLAAVKDPKSQYNFPSTGAGTISRSEEHTSELQSLMRISYAVFCLKKKKKNTKH